MPSRFYRAMRRVCVFSGMKVYIRYNSQVYDNEGINEIAETAYYHILTKWKYKIMWHLRSVENEINDEGGIIIVDLSGKIEIKQFTEELTEKIHELLAIMKDD